MTHTFSDDEDIPAGLGNMSLHERDDIVHRQKVLFDHSFGKLSRETHQVIYTGYLPWLPIEQCQARFHNDCVKGHVNIRCRNLDLKLVFGGASPMYPGECDYVKEPGKVHLRSHFKLDGIFVVWVGWIDLRRFTGVGRLEFDKERAVKPISTIFKVYDSVIARIHRLSSSYDPSHLSR